MEIPSHSLAVRVRPGTRSFQLIIILASILFSTWCRADTNAPPVKLSDTTLHKCQTIALAMFQYAHDHAGNYPDGSSSTEVFQKLADENYLTVPDFYYVPLPGKKHQQPAERLKPENVSFDVTAGANLNDSVELPLVFLTGYKVTYQPGGKAVSLTAPCPPFQIVTLRGLEPNYGTGAVQIVAYADLSMTTKMLESGADGHDYVRNFIGKDFDAHGQVYRQLTPDGVLK
jgi:hypothetical protein